jgi:hypothetical protein
MTQTDTSIRRLVEAARNADWQQVVLNGGPPCFHLEDGRFCFRAFRWQGHGIMHDYVSLESALTTLAMQIREEDARIADDYTKLHRPFEIAAAIRARQEKVR